MSYHKKVHRHCWYHRVCLYKKKVHPAAASDNQIIMRNSLYSVIFFLRGSKLFIDIIESIIVN